MARFGWYTGVICQGYLERTYQEWASTRHSRRDRTLLPSTLLEQQRHTWGKQDRLAAASPTRSCILRGGLSSKEMPLALDEQNPRRQPKLPGVHSWRTMVVHPAEPMASWGDVFYQHRLPQWAQWTLLLLFQNIAAESQSMSGFPFLDTKNESRVKSHSV